MVRICVGHKLRGFLFDSFLTHHHFCFSVDCELTVAASTFRYSCLYPLPISVHVQKLGPRALLCNATKPFVCSFSTERTVNTSTGVPYSSETSSQGWNSALGIFVKKLDTIRLLHSILIDSSWSTEIQESLKNANVVFGTDIVVQVLRSGIPPKTGLHFFHWLEEEQAFTHTFYTYNAIIDILRNSGCIEDMTAVIEDYRSSKIGIDPAYFHNLIQWYGKANNLDAALKSWNQMQDSGMIPGASLYSVMMDLLANHKHYHELPPLYHQMVDRGCALSPCTYTSLIKHLVAVDRLDSAFEIFMRLPMLNVRHTAMMFAILLSGFASACKAEQVRNLVMQMKDVGVKPTRQMLAFVQGLTKSGKSMEAQIVLSSFWPELSLQQGGDFCLELQQATSFHGDEEDDGAELLDTPVHESIEFGSIYSEAGYDPCINARALAYALKKWDPKVVSYLEASNIVWTSQLVHKVLCSVRKADVAMKFYNWLQHQPTFKCTSSILCRMIVIVAVNRDLKSLEHLLRTAKQEGVHLSVAIMTAAIKAYGMMKNVGGAVQMFHMMKDFGLEPNVDAYANVIHALVKQGSCFKAKQYFEEMQQVGLRPSSKIYVMLLECFGLAGGLYPACSIFQQIVDTGLPPDGDVYTAMIKVYFWNQKADMALECFKDCLKAGIVPTAECIETMSNGMRLLNRHSDVAILLRQAVEEVAVRKVTYHSDILTQVHHILEKNFLEKDLILHNTSISGG